MKSTLYNLNYDQPKTVRLFWNIRYNFVVLNWTNVSLFTPSQTNLNITGEETTETIPFNWYNPPFCQKNLENPFIILYSHKTAFNVVTSRFLAFIALIVHFCSSCKVYQWSFIDRHKFQCLKLNNLRILILQEVFAMNEKTRLVH